MIDWREPTAEWGWPTGQIHVWAFSLDLPPESLARLAAGLCPEERARAGRFHFEIHRSRFIAGRGSLRSILGRYLDLDPRTVEFQYNARGKPALGGVGGTSGLEFNLAHTGGLALLAVAHRMVVGVDVEEIRVLPEFDALVERFFSARESAAFQGVKAAEKPAAFFNLWTRKEAWLKATGEGIGELLNRVEVSFLPGVPAHFLELPPGWESAEQWPLRALRPAAGAVAALTYRGSEMPVECWHWLGGSRRVE